MRKSALMVIASLVLCLGATAFANDDDHHRDENRLRLRCKFLNDGSAAKGAAKGKGGYGNTCEVSAEVRDFDDHDHGRFTALNDDGHHHDHDRRHRARLLVACGDRTIYRDGAIHSSFGDWEFLAGFPGENPVLKYSTNRPHHHHDGDRRDRDEAFITDAWLKIGESVMTGFCAIEEERDHHHGPRSTPTTPGSLN